VTTKLKERDATPDLLAGVPEEPSAPKPSAVAKAKTKPKNELAKIEATRPPANALDALASLVKDPNVDPVKMRELFKLYQETEARQQFHDALLSIDLPEISRDGKIPVRGGKDLRFASFENVHKAVMRLLKDNGFRMSFAPMPGEGGGLVVECKLIRGIYEEKCIVPISTAPASRAMNSQQAIGAAIKYASRYGVMYLLNLRSEAPEDRDTDATPPADSETITMEQAVKLRQKIEECGLTHDRFCKTFKIKAPTDLLAADFDAAIKRCENYKAQAQASRR
jgi:ERF superfamily protein